MRILSEHHANREKQFFEISEIYFGVFQDIIIWRINQFTKNLLYFDILGVFVFALCNFFGKYITEKNYNTLAINISLFLFVSQVKLI